MKKYTTIMLAVLAAGNMSAGIAIGQVQSTVLQYPEYSINARVSLDKGSQRAKHVALIDIAGMNSSLADSENVGLIYPASSLKKPVMELVDVERGVTIKAITLEEYLGKGNNAWKPVQGMNESSSLVREDELFIKSKSGNIRLVRSITTQANPGLPLGKSLRITVSAVSDQPRSIAAVFHAHFLGDASSSGSVLAVKNSTGRYGIAIQNLPGSAIQVNQQKSTATITSPAVKTSPMKASHIMAITMAGTTARFAEGVTKQLDNIVHYLQKPAYRPDFSATTVMDKAFSSPGDTLTYSLYYHNVGTGAGTGVTIDNPIPHGALFIENSASGKGSIIDLTRGESSADGDGIVNKITWKFTEPISPGEERVIQFKILVL